MRNKTCNDQKNAIKSKRKKVWCKVSRKEIRKHLGWETGNRPKPRLLRCPKCKQRFKTTWNDCGDGDCWHEEFPKHKRFI